MRPVDLLIVSCACVYVVVSLRVSAETARAIRLGPRAASFIAGLAIIGAALSERVDELAAETLSAHMAQHLVLWLVVPPLLIWGRPLAVLALAASADRRRFLRSLETDVSGVRRVVTHPLVVWGATAAVLWGWHLPRMYQGAIGDELVHAAEHALFLGAGLLWWSVVIGPMQRRRIGRGAVIVLVFATMVQSSWLAMVLSLVDRVVYPVYVRADTAAALRDQQTAGVAMWVTMSIVFAIVFALVFLRWFVELEARRRARDATRDAAGTAEMVSG